MMQGEGIENIREASRNILFLNRKQQKDDEIDVRRSLANLSLTQPDVAIIANKLKSKSSISASEIKLLQNALVDDPKNIELVLNTNGALRGLVRELSGHDINKQCAACGCLCNLALGDSKACYTVAKAAGIYLVAAMETLSTQLAVCCAWTVGNLCGGGERACRLLRQHGALAALCAARAGRDVAPAALYALAHAAGGLGDGLSPEHLQRILHILSKTDLNMESSLLLFILSCHKDFIPEALPESYIKKIIEQLAVSMENHLNTCKITNKRSDDSKCCELVYLARVLANCDCEHVYEMFTQYFINNNLVPYLKVLIKTDEDESILWLLGNSYKYCGESNFFFQLLF